MRNALLLLLAVPVFAASLVVPGANAAVDPVSNNGFPFNLPLWGISTMRYQQVYGAAEFTAQGPMLITGIRFRRDGANMFTDPFSGVGLNVDIRLSTTSAPVDALSVIFADNTGADETQVLNGLLTISSTGAGTPNPFDIIVDFSTPFAFNPALGNLLLDIRNTTAATTAQFDASDSDTDSVSRLFARDSGATSGETDSLGLITQFEYTTAVPEPSSALLLLAPLAWCAIRRRP